MRSYLLRSVFLLSVMLVTPGAFANVIYDVTVRYEGGIAAELTFTMEFSDSSGTKSIADLIGGDFTAESLEVNGVQLALTVDNNASFLQFSAADPESILFTSSDQFTAAVGGGCASQTQAAIACVAGIAQFFSLPVEDITVQERTIGAVPEPGVIALLSLGLPGMLLVRRSASRRRMHR